MVKNPKKRKKRNPERTALVQKVAAIHGVSTCYVNKVLNADRKNEEIVSTYMFLQEGSNALLEEVKKLIPFNN